MAGRDLDVWHSISIMEPWRPLATRKGLAVEHLLGIRPQAHPNVLVLHLTLETFLSREQAETATLEMVNHPALLANRFHRSK